MNQLLMYTRSGGGSSGRLPPHPAPAHTPTHHSDSAVYRGPFPFISLMCVRVRLRVRVRVRVSFIIRGGGLCVENVFVYYKRNRRP